MKKRVYILLFMGVLLLSGCNLFSGLDKEDLSAPGAFEFKIDDAMSEGDYTVVVGLIDDKISNSTELSAVNASLGTYFDSIEDLTTTATSTEIEALIQQITDYLDDNIGNAAAQEYVDLKVKQAEAYSGEAGVKLTDVIANLTSETQPNLASLNVANKSSARISISDIIPDNVLLEKLDKASQAYGASLPISTGAAFDFLTGKYGSSPYLNAALIHAITALKHFLYIFDNDGNMIMMSTSDSGFSSALAQWDILVPHVKSHLISAKYYLNRYTTANSNGLISTEDITNLNTNFDDLLTKISFDTNTYADFTSEAGLQ